MIRVPKGYLFAAHGALPKSHSKPPRYVPPRNHRHLVRRGDTLSGIAVKYGVRVRELRALNRLNRRSLIRVGQRIKIPSYSKRRSHANVSRKKRGKGVKQGYHIVRRGDTVSDLPRSMELL